MSARKTRVVYVLEWDGCTRGGDSYEMRRTFASRVALYRFLAKLQARLTNQWPGFGFRVWSEVHP